MRSWRVREPRQRMALRLTGAGLSAGRVSGARARCSRRARGDEFRERLRALRRRGAGTTSRSSASALFDVWLVAVRGASGPLLFVMDLWPRPARPRPARAPAASRPTARSAAALDAALLARRAALGVARRRPSSSSTATRRSSSARACGGPRSSSRAARSRCSTARSCARRSRTSSRTSRAAIPLKSWVLMGAPRAHVLEPRRSRSSRARSRATRSGSPTSAPRRACGDRVALASGLLKLHRATAGRRRRCRARCRFAGALAEPLARVRSHDIEVRCRRLLDAAPGAAPVRSRRASRSRARPHGAAVLRGMSATYDRDARAARAAAGAELARMLATLVLVVGVASALLAGARRAPAPRHRRRATSRPRGDDRGGGAPARRARRPARLLPGAARLAARGDPRRRRAARLACALTLRRARRRRRGSALVADHRRPARPSTPALLARPDASSTSRRRAMGGRPATLASRARRTGVSWQELRWRWTGARCCSGPAGRPRRAGPDGAQPARESGGR